MHNAPLGTRAFRKTITLPACQLATSATIYMDADNEFTLYVQGKIVGSGTNWEIPQKFIVNLPPDSSSQVITIAVFTRNDDGPTSPAGLIAAVDLTVQNTDCGSAGPSFVTDGTWKFNVGTPVGFQQVGYDDSAWPAAIVEGKYGVSPWGGVPVPAAVSGSTGPIAGAPST
ncbi:hypothetical protein CPC08DRAFT_771225 [Agrocybe pediades]|nr:hypothetical protein CPC08DRAFT_771225 [Agrocybe pediades]